MKKSSNKGFTLVELIIVIAILAIIMLIAIPNFSGIQQRMQVRADKSTAAQIGKAVRVWFTDYTTDGTLVSGATAGKYLPVKTLDEDDAVVCPGLPVVEDDAVTPIHYEELNGIDEYISLNQKPSSLKNGTVQDTAQKYGVFLTADATSTSAKIAIAITGTTTGLTFQDEDENSLPVSVNYDGSAAGVAYIEP